MNCTMLDAFKSLPEDADRVRSFSVKMLWHIPSLACQNEKLKAELHGDRKARCRAKLKSVDQRGLDLSVDDEIARAAEDHRAGQSPNDEMAQPNKRQRSRKSLTDDLEREDEVLSPGDAYQGSGGTLRRVGGDITQELGYISGSGLVAHMLAGKYCDHRPRERQSRICVREGIDLHRSTLNDRVGRITALLEPLAEHLARYTGTVHANGFAGFNGLFGKGKTDEQACIVHVRRKFVDEVERTGSPIAQQGGRLMAGPYTVETEARAESLEERAALRQAKAKPMLDTLELWLKAQLRKISGRTRLAEAIRHALNRMPMACGYLSDGHLELDNNTCQRSIQPTALGRKKLSILGVNRRQKSGCQITRSIASMKS